MDNQIVVKGRSLATQVCFLGGARYSQPLDPTAEKKFRAMTALGEICVIGFSTGIRPRMFTEHASFYLLPQLPLPALRYLELFVLGQILTLWLILRHRAQIVVAQSPYEGFVAALAIKIAGWLGYEAGLAVEVHGDFEESLFLYRKIRFRGFYRFVMNRIASYSIQRADVLRAISASTREQLQRWAPAKRIVKFTAWTDIEAFLRAGESKRDTAQTIVYAGVLNPVKGIHHLINAFALAAQRFPAAELMIVGKIEHQRYSAELIKQIAELRMEQRVRVTGAVSQAVLASMVARATVFVLPSLSEGLPRVVIEAMAAGTPVIGSRVGGIPELIDDGVNGFLIEPGDERALAEKLRWLLENRDQARAMGERARGFAAKQFSTESFLRGYERLFDLAHMRRELRQHAAFTL